MKNLRVSVGDIEIEYTDVGEGDRAFVLVHGFTGSRDDWREQLEPLSRLGRTIALDLRGHGGTTNPGRPEAYSLDGLAADLAGFADALGLDRFDLLGHSMGGMVALRYTLAQPPRVASLLLMDTSPRPIGLMPSALWDRVAERVLEGGVQAMLPGMRRQAESGERPAAAARCEREMGPDLFWDRIRTKLEAMDPHAFATLGPAMRDDPGVSDRLGEIRCPTSVIVGAEDQAFLAPSDDLERGIKGAQRFTIPDAAHSPQLEAPPAWLKAVSEHLARARARA